MQAFFDVTTCGKTQPKETLNGITRKYYIAAEEVEWDYAPSGLNKYDGGTLLDIGR